MKKLIQPAIGILILVMLATLAYFITVAISGFLGSLDRSLVLAIVAASATILTSTVTVVLGRILERKKEIEGHFRQKKTDQYDELLTILYAIMDGDGTPSEDSVRRLRDWQRRLILIAGPKTFHTFVNWVENLKSDNATLRTILMMEEFFKSLRTDLGISNRGIAQGDFARLILKHGELFVQMAKTRPDMTLAEFSEMEKILYPVTDAGSAQLAPQNENEPLPT